LGLVAHGAEIDHEGRGAELVEGHAGASDETSATTGSSAATTRWPSVCPSGTSRTAAETRFAANACR
jgi:hypothetical protein